MYHFTYKQKWKYIPTQRQVYVGGTVDSSLFVFMLGSAGETSCPEIADKTTSSTEIINVESESQKGECPEVVEIHKVPSVQDVTHSNDMVNVTDENTAPEHVVEREGTQQETSSSHDNSTILATEEPPKTIQFMDPLAMTGLSLLKRKVDQTSAISIKMAITERDKLVKKILQSAQKRQTGIELLDILCLNAFSENGMDTHFSYTHIFFSFL